jgi:hypothetical protein
MEEAEDSYTHPFGREGRDTSREKKYKGERA